MVTLAWWNDDGFIAVPIDGQVPVQSSLGPGCFFSSDGLDRY